MVYKRKLSGKRAIELKSCPLTEQAGFQHILRIYCQVANFYRHCSEGTMSSLTILTGRWKRDDLSYHADEEFRNKTEEGCESEVHDI